MCACKKSTLYLPIIALVLMTPAARSQSPQKATALQTFREEFVQMVKNLEKSQVSVSARMDISPQKTPAPEIEMTNAGAGLIMDTNHIVVKQKIIQGSDNITIEFYDRTIAKGSLVGMDDESGLAVLQTDREIPLEFQPVKLENPALIQPGEPVLILGNSLGIMPAVALGVVNCTRNDGMLQLSADLPAGTSGGAVFDFSGQLIGLVAVEINLFPDELPYSADLLAGETVLVSPIRNVRRILNTIIAGAKKRQVYFGVAVDDWPSQLGGAHIKQVYKDSPAAVSGLRIGDIVLSTESRKVATAYDLFQIISNHAPGDEVTMQILRGDQIFPMSVRLVTPPSATERRDNNASNVAATGAPAVGGQQEQINNEFLVKRIKRLEVELQILKAMVENRQ